MVKKCHRFTAPTGRSARADFPWRATFSLPRTAGSAGWYMASSPNRLSYRGSQQAGLLPTGAANRHGRPVASLLRQCGQTAGALADDLYHATTLLGDRGGFAVEQVKFATLQRSQPMCPGDEIGSSNGEKQYLTTLFQRTQVG